MTDRRHKVATRRMTVRLFPNHLCPEVPNPSTKKHTCEVVKTLPELYLDMERQKHLQGPLERPTQMSNSNKTRKTPWNLLGHLPPVIEVGGVVYEISSRLGLGWVCVSLLYLLMSGFWFILSMRKYPTRNLETKMTN